MRFPNGYGTVYKLKGNRRRPWIARIPVECKIVNGKYKQLYKTVGYFEDKPQAIDALVKCRIKPIPDKANITLEELYDEWSKGKYKHISKSTVDGYKAGWKYISVYEKQKFKDLRKAHFQSVIDNCFENGMSRSTLEKIKVVAIMMYDYAIEHDIVEKNYARLIVLPKVDKEQKKRFAEPEVKIIEDNADKVEWVDTVLMLIYTGLRINEFLGLTKFSIDLKEQTINTGSKTEAGKDRIIPIHPKILKYVQKWYNKNGERLVCDENGQAILDKIYREKMYYPALEALNIRKLNPHCCRHTFASILSDAGVDTKSIQELLGHAKYSFTADTYTHKDIEGLRKAISKL